MIRSRAAQIRAGLASFLRVLVACAATAYGAITATRSAAHLSTSVFDWTGADAKAFGSAIVSALILTGINALRAGDTRFGRGAQPTRVDSPPPAETVDQPVDVAEVDPSGVADVTIDPADLILPDGPDD